MSPEIIWLGCKCSADPSYHLLFSFLKDYSSWHCVVISYMAAYKIRILFQNANLSPNYLLLTQVPP